MVSVSVVVDNCGSWVVSSEVAETATAGTVAEMDWLCVMTDSSAVDSNDCRADSSVSIGKVCRNVRVSE